MLLLHSAMNRRLALAALAVVSASISPVAAQVDPYDAGNYYDGITGNGTSLMNQLEARLKSGHNQTTYGEVRYALPDTDRDPNNSSRMLLVYTRESNVGTWQSGNYESREHVWPASRQGVSGSNSTAGRYGDIHMLKPAEQGINTTRSNLSFGLDNTTGAARREGSYFYAGDADRGDVARIAFYAATRWQDDGLKLVEGTGSVSSREMGDLSSLLEWHYLDVPDTFERRRNQVIYDSYTNNRNAYIDRPEYAWSVFRGNDNDTQLAITTPAGEGAMGKVLLGTAVSPTVELTIDKNGQDGTYYEVRTEGDASSSAAGRYNAFAIGSSAAASTATIDVGLPSGFGNVAGQYAGSVIIDNLDVTTGGGTGRGANDADDVYSVSATVVTPSNPSFSQIGDVESATIDLGIIGLGLGDFESDVPVYNLDEFGVGFNLVAGLDLDGAIYNGGSFFGLGAIATETDIAGGAAGQVDVILSDDQIGTFSTEFFIGTSDADDVTGGRGTFGGESLTLSLIGEVRLPGDANGDGNVNLADFGILRANFGSVIGDYLTGDFNRDGNVNLADFGILRAGFGGSVSSIAILDAWVATVPEPMLASVMAIGTLTLLQRRRA